MGIAIYINLILFSLICSLCGLISLFITFQIRHWIFNIKGKKWKVKYYILYLIILFFVIFSLSLHKYQKVKKFKIFINKYFITIDK